MGRPSKWTDHTILKAIERFRLLNGDYPTSHDFQFTDYLPDPSTIRALYGGLPQFRKKFGFDVQDYTKGNVRSNLNRILNDRAKDDEDRIFLCLVKQFGEICVHKEKEFAYRNRVDFQVYHADGIFGVDTFYPKNRAALVNIFNLKHVKYLNFIAGPVYLVCMNPMLDQTVLDEYVRLRKNETGAKILLMSEATFLEVLNRFSKMSKF